MLTCGKKIDEFKQKAKQHQFSPMDLLDATLILSNIGIFGASFATPLMMPPMVAIVAMGRVKEQPCVVNGEIVAHPLLPISISVDHRFLSGAEAALFLNSH